MGARNNDVFTWSGICIKLYRRTDRRRVEREWHGLAHVARLGLAPRPLWLDDHPEQPALGMTLLAGSPADEDAFPLALRRPHAPMTRPQPGSGPRGQAGCLVGASV